MLTVPVVGPAPGVGGVVTGGGGAVVDGSPGELHRRGTHDLRIAGLPVALELDRPDAAGADVQADERR